MTTVVEVPLKLENQLTQRRLGTCDVYE